MPVHKKIIIQYVFVGFFKTFFIQLLCIQKNKHHQKTYTHTPPGILAYTHKNNQQHWFTTSRKHKPMYTYIHLTLKVPNKQTKDNNNNKQKTTTKTEATNRRGLWLHVSPKHIVCDQEIKCDLCWVPRAEHVFLAMQVVWQAQANSVNALLCNSSQGDVHNTNFSIHKRGQNKIVQKRRRNSSYVYRRTSVCHCYYLNKKVQRSIKPINANESGFCDRFKPVCDT